MRDQQRLLITMMLTLPLLSGCFLDGRDGTSTSTGTSETSESEVASNGISVDTASSQLIFGGATFDTATWK